MTGILDFNRRYLKPSFDKLSIFEDLACASSFDSFQDANFRTLRSSVLLSRKLNRISGLPKGKTPEVEVSSPCQFLLKSDSS